MMKIRKKALRRFIRESIYKNSRQINEVGIAPGVPQSLTSKLYETIIDLLPMRGAQGMSGAEVVDSVNQEHPDVDAELIYDFLDTLLEDGVVNFDVEMDEWTLRT